MSYKQLLLILIGLHSVTAMTEENAPNLLVSNETIATADAWINNTLDFQLTRNCIDVEGFHKKRSTGNELSSTVAILKQEQHPNEIVSYFICTGSLIHAQVVLTAAHCFTNISTDNMVVHAGATINETLHPDEQEQTRQIDSVIIHENYTSDSFGNNIALIFLKKPFAINNIIATMCLGPDWGTVAVNCFLTSWNMYDRNVKGFPKPTMNNRTVVRNEKCQKVLQVTKLGREFTLTNDSICVAGGNGGADVLGNGGAPLICEICGRKRRRFVQIGILLMGFNSALLPDVLTNVAPHREWIASSSLKKRFKIHTCINKNKH